jgi:outer membrane protein assembly factor BamD
LGLENEAKKYANLLGYNYQSSKWYEKSYIVFNKMYKKNKKNKSKNKNKKSDIILKKFKFIFDLDE